MSDDKFTMSTNPDDWPDGLPPCLIGVDKEGRLWHYGAEMIHKGINRMLMEHVELDEKGRYIIDFNKQRCYVEVEDTFFVILSTEIQSDGRGNIERCTLILNDGNQEELDPATLYIGRENVLYAMVKQGGFPARFVRPAYYQLAERILEKDDRFILPFKGRDYPLVERENEA
ncbi:MAG: DUF1285 domain-containing protein [Deltaproteobacteria bacterium]|nr:DUF1285 domain-containing protein [Deltaproteobacteria bacterium]